MIKKCDSKISIRISTQLKNKVDKKTNLPNCKSTSDKYRFFIQTGVEAHDEYQKVLTDPEQRERSKNALDVIFQNEMLVENLMEMDISKLKGLAMAIDLVRGKRKV